MRAELPILLFYLRRRNFTTTTKKNSFFFLFEYGMAAKVQWIEVDAELVGGTCGIGERVAGTEENW